LPGQKKIDPSEKGALTRATWGTRFEETGVDFTNQFRPKLWTKLKKDHLWINKYYIPIEPLKLKIMSTTVKLFLT
jgi:hypothetical protein